MVLTFYQQVVSYLLFIGNNFLLFWLSLCTGFPHKNKNNCSRVSWYKWELLIKIKFNKVYLGVKWYPDHHLNVNGQHWNEAEKNNKYRQEVILHGNSILIKKLCSDIYMINILLKGIFDGLYSDRSDRQGLASIPAGSLQICIAWSKFIQISCLDCQYTFFL